MIFFPGDFKMENGHCITIETKENLGLSSAIHKGKMSKECDQPQGTRKVFQTIQSSAQNQHKLKPSLTSATKKNTAKLVPLKEPWAIYRDPKNEKTFDDKAVQTERLESQNSENEEIDREAYDLMVSNNVPESYWQELAEQRRIALDESLHENEMLHKENEELREENSRLSEMAEKADYFADVIQTILGNDEEGVSKNDEESVSKEDNDQKNEKSSEENLPTSTKESDIISPEEDEVQSESPPENLATSTAEITQSKD